MPTRMKRRDRFVRQIKILLTELEPTRINNRFENCLARVSFPPKIKYREYSVQEFKHTPFVQLRSIPLNQLSITLVNDRNNRLALKDGPAVLIQLEISNMDLSQEFNITCVSHSSDMRLLYPNNTVSNFKVALPQELSLGGWEMALSSLAYPTSVKMKTRDVWWQAESYSATLKIKDKKFEFDPDEYLTTELLVQDVIKQLAEDLVFKNILKIEVSQDPDKVGFLKWTALFEDTSVIRHVRLSFSDDFIRALGGNPRNHTEDEIDETSRLPFTRVMPADVVYVHGIPNIENIRESSIGMLYCDIANTSAVDNQLVPLLGIVPIIPATKTATGGDLYEPAHLMFHKVVNRAFSSIEFTLLQPNGNRHNMTLANSVDKGMVVTLLFRPAFVKGND